MSGTAQPGLASVAVCIPAHGDPAGLSTLLTGLAALDYPKELVHVVVAVDGPDPGLEAVARRAGAVVVVLPVNAGSYAARNAALGAVPEGVTAVLFTDTDCLPRPGWVREHLAALEVAEASGGAVHLVTSTPPRPAEWVDAHRHLGQRHFVEALGFAATCNLAVRRPVVEALRFDDTLRSGGDFDFGQRLAAAGGSITYSENAVVDHPARSSSREVLRKVSRVARGAAMNQARGHQAAQRRDPHRGSALARAEQVGMHTSPLWRMRVRALDAACSLTYARHVPSVVTPALKRRLRSLR